MKKLIGFLLALGLLFTATACGEKENTLIVYDSPTAEGQIIHQMIKMLVEKNTPLSVEVRDEMAMVNNYKDMQQGGSDLFNCYDGTLLSTFLKEDVSSVPEGESIHEYANRLAQEREGFEMLGKMGHENTYAIAVTQETAKKYNLETVSDLVPVASQLIFGAEHEFFSMEGSMKYGPFVSFYGLAFKEAKPIDMFIKYNAIQHGNIDVTEVYSTDGLNKKVGLKILEDDQKFFPDYNCALLIRQDVFTQYGTVAPNLREVLAMMEGLFTTESMTDLTYKVDVEGRTPESVAKEFLEQKGYL